jgi:transcriptional regulator with XRE-family HTH domain
MADASDDAPQREDVSFAEGLARALKVLRTAHDLSRAEIAERAGLSYSYLANIERAVRTPSQATLEALAGALGIETAELIEAAETWRTRPEAEGELSERTQYIAEQIEWRGWPTAPDDADTRLDEAARPGRQPGRLQRFVSRARRRGGSRTPGETPIESRPPPDLGDTPMYAGRRSSGLSLDELEGRPMRLGLDAQDELAARSPGTRSGLPELPEALIDEIEAGSCVAFVGAGFSAAGRLPDWPTLLREIADDDAIEPALREDVESRIAAGSPQALEEAAELLEDRIGRGALVAHVGERLGGPPRNKSMAQRLRWLLDIPFRAILTPNVDGLLSGATPSDATYRQALRPEGHRWWDLRYWDLDGGAFTVKLHGDVNRPDDGSLVLTRRDYQSRLQNEPAYETFLRAVMATSTVLYLGCSLENPYLRRARAEAEALLGQRNDRHPVAYAIANDVARSVQHLYRRIGIQILDYDSEEGSSHRGFDAYLEALSLATNPKLRLARYLDRRQVLWVDPDPRSAGLAYEQLREVASLTSRGGHALETAPDADQAIALLHKRGRRRRGEIDLVITRWGAGRAVSSRARPTSMAQRLLTALRAEDVRCPVIVFDDAADVEARRRLVLGLGAQDYCHSFESLFRTIERVLRPGDETG